MSKTGTKYDDFLIPRCALAVDAFEMGIAASPPIPKQFAFPVDGDSTVPDLSPNHWKMGITVELFRAAAWGTPAELEAALKPARSWLDRELRTQGLWLREQMAGGAHSGMHVQADCVAHMAALRLGNEELIRDTGRVIESWLALCAAVTTPGGLVACVGERQHFSPALELVQLSAAWRVASERKQRGALRDDDHWLDPFWVGPRAVRALMREDELPCPPAGIGDVLLRRRLTIERSPTTVYTEDAAGRWCLVDVKACDASEGHAGVQFGTLPATVLNKRPKATCEWKTRRAA